MKTLSLVLLLMASMAFVLLGCSDNSAPVVASTSVSDHPSTPLMKSSASGAYIERYDMTYYVYWFINENGLLVTCGVNDIQAYCARTGGKETFSYKDLYLPNADPDLRRVMEKLEGTDVTAMAFQVVPGSGVTLRDYICGLEPIAVGTANLRSEDNDVLAWMQDKNNRNAFGYNANGNLVAPDGQKFRLNIVDRYVWDPTTGWYNEVFKIQLTPTGGK
jgi:hypothetical protein